MVAGEGFLSIRPRFDSARVQLRQTPANVAGDADKSFLSTQRLARMTGDEKSQEAASLIPQLLTTKQAAQLVNVGERTFWRWSRSGIAPRPVKIGSTAVRYSRDEVLDWIRAGCPRTDGKAN